MKRVVFRVWAMVFWMLFLINAGNAQLPVPEGRSLRDIVADKYGDTLLIGATIAGSSLYDPIADVMNREFSYVTPENDFKHRVIRSNMSTFNWTAADQWLSHIQRHNQIIRLHGPIAPQCNTWAKEDHRTAAELEEELETFMTAFCKRYNGKEGVEYMDVVNEIALDDGSWFGPRTGTDEWENPWEQIGRDTDPNRTPLYIKQAFAIANEHAPDIKQIVNNHTHPGTAGMERTKETVLYLRDLGYRVDGLGWQAHVDIGWATEENLQHLADLIDWCNANNVEFHITEFSAWRNNIYTQSLEDQAYTYQAILDVMLQKLDTIVMGWNTWHVSDIEGWYYEREPSLFDSRFNPKPAYYATQLALETRGDYSTQHQVAFDVRHAETDEVIDDFIITFNDSVKSPDSPGHAAYNDVFAGRYTVKVENPLYNTLLKKHVNIFRDTSITLTLTPAEYNVLFNVVEEATGKPISFVNASFSIDSDVTDSDGKVGFIVRNGTYPATFDKNGFESFQGDFTIVSDTSFTIELIKTHADVKFRIRNEGRPVNNVEVVLNKDSLYSTSLGMVTFPMLEVEQQYGYALSKEGYKSLEGTINLISDTTVELEMKKSQANLNFEISTDEYNVSRTFIVIDTDTASFNEQGLASFYALPVDSAYIFDLYTEDMPVFTDTLLLTADSTVVITFIPSSIEGPVVSEMFRVYPNPANNVIQIDSRITDFQVEIFTETGRLIRKIDPEDAVRQINVSGFPAGMYWIRLKTGSGKFCSQPILIMN